MVVVTAAFWWTSAAGAGTAEQPAAPSADVSATTLAARSRELAAATRSRDEVLRRVSGSALIRRYFGSRFHTKLLPPDLAELRRAAGQPMDRDLTAVRFATDEVRHRLEAQVLFWSAGLWDWFPYHQSGMAQPATQTADLWFRSFADAEYAYRVRGSAVGPKFLRMPASAPSVAAVRRRIAGWVGAGIVSLPAEGKDRDARLLGIEKAALDGEPVYVIKVAVRWTYGLQEVRYWLAPEKGYALLRRESLGLSEKHPHTANRSVSIWADFTQRDGVWIPRRYEVSQYTYDPSMPADGPSLDRWVFTEQVIFRDIAVGKPVSFDMLQDPAPVGARLDQVWPDDRVPPADVSAQFEGFQWTARSRADLISSTAPAPDARFLTALTGQEYSALKKEWEAD